MSYNKLAFKNGQVLNDSDMNFISAPANEVIYASNFGILPGSVNATKMDEMLSYASTNAKTIKFDDGEYIFSQTINVPSDVSIVGNTKTVFKASTTSVNPLMKVNGADNVYLSHLILQGSNTSKPSSSAGTQVGLWVGYSKAVNIENVEVVGWNKHGLYAVHMSSNSSQVPFQFYKHLQIANCRFYHNHTGAYLDFRCEYTQMVNCLFGGNHIGSVNCGGNNCYSSSQWNANTIGFIVDGGTYGTTGSNPAHASCSACVFNHNTQIAIQVDKAIHGWAFTGCQIFYGKIKLNQTKNIIFSSCLIGGDTIIYSDHPDYPNCNLITGCSIKNSAQLLSGNDGSIYVDNTNILDNGYIPLPNPLMHNIVFSSNEASIAYQSVEDGGVATQIQPPDKSGYTFTGWYKELSCKNLYDFTTPVTRPMVLFAGWTAV